MKRLPPSAAEWIDRSTTLSFTFEGQRYSGHPGDTITTALLASGRKILARSFKYHRPRSVMSLANHDANLVMQDDGGVWSTPNVRADVTPLRDGMRLSAVNTFGGVEKDRAAVLNKLSRFLPVGFYYKAFYGKRLFPLWEKMFRALTGLGRVDFATPHLRTGKRYDFCDVLVIGAGASGLSAALSAARQGASVVVVDENARAGGSLTYQPGTCAQLLEQVAAQPNIRVLTGTYAAGYYADHWIPLVDADKLTKMRAKAVVVAAGAFEQPAVFHNNDLPGVMLAGAAQRLIHRYRIKPCETAVVLVANADGYRAALDLVQQGVAVAALVDLRPAGADAELAAQVAAAGIEVIAGACVADALPGADGTLSAVDVRTFAYADGAASVGAAPGRAIHCDGLIVSVGYAPAANLLYQAGTKMRFDDLLQQFVPDQLPAGVFACGRVNGHHAFDGRVADGARAGSAAAAHAGCGWAEDIQVAPETASPSHPWPIVDDPRGKNFVDFDEDLQFKDFVNAVKEGFDNIELLKRFSTNGMGPSQGKHSNMNGLRILAALTGKAPQQVGTTTARPFYHPVPMAHLAGRGFAPERQTPLHARHDALGAVWMSAGVWQRPEYYARDGVSRIDCIRGEALAVRQGVGVIDVGTLGKLEVIGPDAALFLERVYLSKYAGLAVGMTRYAVMCDEAGVVIDDGVVARLADDHFYFTTTTSGAAAIYRELSRLNAIWKLDCGIVNHTGAFAAINVAGPQAKALLQPLTDVDLSAGAFPFLAVRTGQVAGAPARLMRVGFVGEWGVEIHVPARYAVSVWDAVFGAGIAYGIRPFGVEAQRLLRLEKGHLIVGQDTDGLTTPRDAGLSWAVKHDKPFFVGQRSLQIVDAQPHKQQLVGFALPHGFSGTAPSECHLIIDGGQIAGRVTSIAYSPTLGRYIGLAYVAPALAAPGTTIKIRITSGALVDAEVVRTPFYDPDHIKQKEVA